MRAIMTSVELNESKTLRMLGRWPVALALLIWIAAVAWPMLAIAPALSQSLHGAASIATGEASAPQTLPRLLLTSVCWGAIVALGSALIGWLPGRWLGSLLNRSHQHGGGFVPVAAFMLVPLCLPAYVVFYAWWQSWPAGTALHRWVIEHQAMQWAREATLLAGMLCWSWPIVALCVAGSAARRPRMRDEMLAIDGAPWRVRAMDQLRTDAPGLAIGFLLVFLATLNNTTCFDLSEVFTFANELRARRALGATPTQVLSAATPILAIALLGAAAIWWVISRRAPQLATASARPARSGAIGTSITWFVAVIVPLAMFCRNVMSENGVGGMAGVSHVFDEFSRLYGESTLWTLGMAMISGIAAAMVTFGLAMMWHSERRTTRFAAHVVSLMWIVWSLLPGTILGMALEAAFNRPPLDGWIFRAPLILNIAQLASAGFVAVFFARWSVAGEPRVLQDLRRLDGAQSLRGLWLSARPTMLAASFASFAIVTVMSVGEVAVTAQVVPPLPIERTPLAMTLLNDMHYQRPQTVMMASLMMTLLAIIGALCVALVWRASLTQRRVPRTFALTVLAASLCASQGCSRSSASEPQPLDVEYLFGSPGSALGQFGYPRCIDVDRQRHRVFVIDKTARVQRFDEDGHAEKEWHMPEMQQGKPTGVTVAPDGHVWVADTHYFRVIEYDADGNEIRRFGSYGEEPGQFIYVTDIAFGPDGSIYVSEYGGNDRIQVFAPDGAFLFQFGSFGTGQGQFSRPQSLGFSNDGKELFITDACNHRIVVTDPKGNWIRTFGAAGRAAGELAYPYGLEVLPDDTLLVAEFGNNRIQRFNRDGKSLGVYGRVGRGEGEVQYPWAVAADDDRIFVLDSGNNRVQVIDGF